MGVRAEQQALAKWGLNFVIEEYLPRKLSDAEVAEAIEKAIEEAEATSIRDMGKVIGRLKAQYNGQMDFGRVGLMVKSQLG